MSVRAAVLPTVSNAIVALAMTLVVAGIAGSMATDALARIAVIVVIIVIAVAIIVVAGLGAMPLP
jgi:hypothetical protein